MSKNVPVSAAEPAHSLGRNPFTLVPCASDALSLDLIACPPGSTTAPKPIWTRKFRDGDDIAAIIDAVNNEQLDVVFLGHLTLNFGASETNCVIQRIINDAHAHRLAEDKAAAETAKKYQIIELFTYQKNSGFFLGLQRKSCSDPEWYIRFNRASERDRLCDWLKWQKPHFKEFLDYAAKSGGEALSNRVIAEMFDTERWIKKEGRGAGGTRPLRMWRGT